MTALLGSASTLRAGAERLAAAGREFSEGAGQLGAAAGGTHGGWSGPASVAFAGAADHVGQGCRLHAQRLQEVAAAGRRYADRLEQAQSELARMVAQQARLGEEELALRARAAGVGAAAEPAARLAQLAADRERLAVATQQVFDRHRLDQSAFAAALAEGPPAPATLGLAEVLLAERAFLGQARSKVTEAKKLATRARAVVEAFRAQATIASIRRLPDLPDATTAQRLAAARQSLQRATDSFTGGRLPGSLAELRSGAKAVGGRINLAMTAWEGVQDVVRGDPEHPGFRDVATRVAGAGGAVGAGLLLAGAATPVGMALVTGYGAYKLGTWVYDHREDIKRVATQVWQRVSPAVEAGRQAVAGAVDAAAETVAAGAAAVTEKAGAIRDRLAGGLSRLVPRPRFGW